MHIDKPKKNIFSPPISFTQKRSILPFNSFSPKIYRAKNLFLLYLILVSSIKNRIQGNRIKNFWRQIL